MSWNLQLLSDRLMELNSKVEVLEGETANIHTQRMLQMKVKELESKLELELATKKRIEVSFIHVFKWDWGNRFWYTFLLYEYNPNIFLW